MVEKEKYKEFLLRFAFWAAIVIIVVAFFRYLLGPLTPFLIALAVAAIVQPLARKIAPKIKTNKKLVSLLLVLLCYILLVGIIVLIVAGIVSVIVDWANTLPDFFTDSMQPALIELGDKIIRLLSRFDPDINKNIEAAIPDIISKVGGSVMDFSMTVVGWASSVGSRLPEAMLATVICIIASIFIAIDYDKLSGAVTGFLPERVNRILSIAKKALGEIVGKYVKSYLIILLMTFAQIFIGLLLIGIEDAVYIAVLIAVFDLLPIVGSGLILAPWAIINLLRGDLAMGIGLAALWIIVIVVRQYAEPKIVGKQVGLHPLVTLLCLWVGLKLAGGIGMFAMPIGLLILLELQDEGVILVRPGENAKETKPQKA